MEDITTPSARPIAILGSGRCATSLLQSLLNVSSKMCIWGEHAGFLKGLATAFFDVRHDSSIRECCYEMNYDPRILVNSAPPNFESNWINPFDAAAITANFRDFITSVFNNNLLTPGQRWGFKEIRYRYNDRVVDMLKELFPAIQLILLVRNPWDTLLSMMVGWNCENVGEMPDELFTERVKKYAEIWSSAGEAILSWDSDRDLSTLIIRYEDLTTDGERYVKRIYSFLGEELPLAAIAAAGAKSKQARGRLQQRTICAARLRKLLYPIQTSTGAVAYSLGYRSPENSELMTIW